MASVDTAPTLPALPKLEKFFDFWIVIHQLLSSITLGGHELQRYFGSFTNNIPIGFIRQVYATAKTVTANGNARIDTSQSKFGGASGSFDGTNSYLSTLDSADWAFGVGPFTIDFWVRFNVVGSAMFYDQYVDNNNRIEFYLDQPAHNLTFLVISGGSTLIQVTKTTTPFSASTWYHLAVVRSGNSFYIFRDGTQVSTTDTNASGVPDSAGALVIGRFGGGAGYYLNGWLDEYRASKGVARWTSNFTPPTTEYVSDSYSVLLLHMNGVNGSTTFTDDSAGPDFSISASPTSQSVGAGSTAFYILNLAASGGYAGTVTLSVTSGCPSGVTCTATPSPVSSFPNTATLSVPTLITTPPGTTTVTVTATDGALTHTAQVSLTVVGPTSFNFNVKSSATQVVVTLMYGWSGSGAPPQGTISIAGPSGTPTLLESGAVVYDRTSISVSGGGNTYNLIHRVTFTIAAPGSSQVWTAYVSLAGVSSYTLTIEVS